MNKAKSPISIQTWKSWHVWYSSLKPEHSPIKISENIELIYCEEKGWGLYASKNIITLPNKKILGDDLFGIIKELTPAIRKKSKSIGFNSKITIRGKVYVLFGPISLANHQCAHQLRFKDPWPINSKKVYAFNFGKKLSIKKGHEISVRYCNKPGLWFSCSCLKCKNKVMRN